jgi:tRNA-modifying protein YgfZ
VDELLSVLVPRDFVQVEGADAASFLQGQLSQDIQPLSVGDSAWSFLLQPQGKVDAWLRVTRVADDAFVLDVDEGFAEAVLTRLNRFKLRVKAELSVLDWRCVAFRGPGAADEALTAAGASDSARAFAVDAEWPGIEAFDVIGPSDSVPDSEAAASIEQYERARIESGVPAMGRELTDATIPAESGVVARSVSFTKGCFTGQELVARIDSRGGNVPRPLRLLRAGAVVPTGARLVQDGRDVGVVTSSASVADGSVALALVVRAVEPPADVQVSWDGGETEGRVHPLPAQP